jgi:hypothetical protein
MARVWRWGLIVLLWLAVPAASARASAPVAIGSGPGGLLALAAQGGVGYAVIGSDDAAKPFALVRSSGRGAGTPVPFGGPGAGNPDAAPGPDGVQVAWSREVSSALEFSVAPALDPADATVAGLGTGPPQLDDGALAYPDRVGDAMLGTDQLTADAPEHRHLPLDAAAGLVLDLDQRRASTQLRLLGPNAPTRPAVSLARREDLEGSLAVAGGRAYVAFARNGRAFLATAELRPGASWSTKLVAEDITGRPAVAHAGGRTYVAYARRGDVYLDRARLAPGTRPLLAADGDGILMGWTRGKTALLARDP